MSNQLSLLPRHSDLSAAADDEILSQAALPFAPAAGWSLDAATRRRGRQGVAEARLALRSTHAKVRVEAHDRSGIAA